jgi:crossover junction endodeoxyribonuclease RuvC
LVEAGVFRLKQGRPVAERLVELEGDLVEAIGRLKPDVVAVEKVFSHYKHPTTAAIMGHARGVVLLVIQRAGVRLVELGATEVKKSLTGHGHAGKAQMQDAVAAQLGLGRRPEPADVADAIAIALCCLRRSAADERR